MRGKPANTQSKRRQGRNDKFTHKQKKKNFPRPQKINYLAQDL
jgi:hypothetical protein